MEFVIVTGMSGAGKTSALHVLEDLGYYCVDNIPSSLLSTLYKLCSKTLDEMMKRFEEGRRLVSFCTSELETIRQRIEKVTSAVPPTVEPMDILKS